MAPVHLQPYQGNHHQIKINIKSVKKPELSFPLVKKGPVENYRTVLTLITKKNLLLFLVAIAILILFNYTVSSFLFQLHLLF